MGMFLVQIIFIYGYERIRFFLSIKVFDQTRICKTIKSDLIPFQTFNMLPVLQEACHFQQLLQGVLLFPGQS